jgi:hypothetical protein
MVFGAAVDGVRTTAPDPTRFVVEKTALAPVPTVAKVALRATPPNVAESEAVVPLLSSSKLRRHRGVDPSSAQDHVGPRPSDTR